VRRELRGVSEPDPFDVLGVEARPFPDSDVIGEAYRRAAAECHPDRPGGDGERLSFLNAARERLSQPSSLLRDLARRLPSARGVSGISESAVPTEAFELFSRTAHAMRLADEAIQAEPASPRSRLAEAAWRSVQRRAERVVGEVRTDVLAWISRLDAGRRELDNRWPAVAAEEVETLANRYCFAERWDAGLREQQFRLSRASCVGEGKL